MSIPTVFENDDRRFYCAAMEKKKPLTPEEKAECLALKALFVSKKRTLKLSQESLGAALGVSQAAVSHYLNGVNALNLPVAIKMAGILGVRVSDFSPRLAKIGVEAQWSEPAPSTGYSLIPVEVWDDDTPLDEDTVEVPIFKSAEFSSGPGSSQQLVVDEGMRLRYGKRTLRNNGVDPANVAGGLNRGRSNEPVYPDGCIVMMDLSKTEIVDGEPYGLEHSGEFRVKQLYRLPGGGLRLRSYNREEYPDEDYGADWPEQIRIVGWVWIHQPKARKWKGR